MEQIEFRLGRIFILCMLVNIYISQNMSEDAWVDFKSFGLLGMTLLQQSSAALIFTVTYLKMIKKMMGKNNGFKPY